MTGDVKNQIKRPIQVRLEDDLEPTSQLIDYCLRESKQNDRRYRQLENYYWNETAIQSRSIGDPDKPNNRVSHAFAKYITKIATAHFMGKGIIYTAEDQNYNDLLNTTLDSLKNDIKVWEEAKEMSKRGISYELLWIDPDGKLKTEAYNADEIVPVFSTTPGNFLAMALHPYEIKSYDNRKVVKNCVDLYTKYDVYFFERRGGTGKWELKEIKPHHFSDVPVIVRMNNVEMRGDYEDIISQIDAYDKAVSDTANDLDYFSDAYLVLEGIDDVTAEDEDGNEIPGNQTARTMKKDRLFMVPAGSKGYFITKDSSDVVGENHKKRVFKDIFFLSQVPNMTDEEFAGNLSGVAIKYKLFGLQELTIEKQTYFMSSELKKIRLITDYLNLTQNAKYDWKTVKIKWDRTELENALEIAQIIQMLNGILSDETLIGLFPSIENAAEELKKRMEEQVLSENGGFDIGPVTELINAILGNQDFARAHPEIAEAARELQQSFGQEDEEVF